jgi:hypothetical protein
MVRAFQREPGFAELQFRSHQIYFIYDFAQRKGDQELLVNQLSRKFGCCPVRVKAALANELEEPKVRGHHFAVDEDSEGKMLKWIEVQIKKRNLITCIDLRHHCETKYSRSVGRGRVDSFILRHRNNLADTKSTPQEDPRLEVIRILLDETIHFCESTSRG